MPKKRKAKATANAKTGGNTNENNPQTTSRPAYASPQQCLTLMEDEITRCGQLATDGHPKPERCKVHHEQYRTLYKKYKDASKVVDDVKDGAELPAKDHIGRYADWHEALEKACWVRKYLEAIRVEKAGREIHQKRFFLKGKLDDGHKRRLKLLEREMVRAVDVLDALQGRAYELYKPESTLHAMNDRAPPEVEWEKQSKRTTEELLECIRNSDVFHESSTLMPPLIMLTTSAMGDEDLIDMSLRDEKEKIVMVLKPLIDFESFVDAFVEEGSTPPETGNDKSLLEKQFLVYQQFARRIIFHQPTLFMKSLESVSFKDLILSDDFSVVDLAKFVDLFLRPMEFPLKWFKDAVLDALATSRHGTAANVGSVVSRFPLLGGWVFNQLAHIYYFLLQILQPPANVENRFVRLCNNFDDLVGFLSFEAFGLVPSPSFCQSPSHFDPDDPGLSRNHLSLSGIIVADMVSIPVPSQMRGPLPTPQRARQRDCIVWAEVETRAHMFGAVRNERDGFVEAFLRELRARPDLFQVVLRSETDPGRKVEMFGSGPSNSEALPAIRGRQFEAPPSSSPPPPPPSTSGKWNVEWSAMDVLYGTRREMQGYLITLARDLKGWFFRFKTFPVTYFVILDTVPYRDRSVLARNVSWAALRAGGYAEGEYTLRKYAAASDKLLEQRAQERLGWMPEEMKWEITKMQDQMGWTCNVM
ncbi:hypothetical protein HD554DRAFT_2029732 [Boletus coccyginus]|nr:hypothetical protein HD554DRAFT_2029732 [Boletus coccyginus]